MPLFSYKWEGNLKQNKSENLPINQYLSFGKKARKDIVLYIMKYFFSFYFISLTTLLFSQFAPSVGQIGTTAIYKDSSVFVNWANQSTITRGLQDISIPVSGYANVGDSLSACGIAGSNGVVSLGDGGVAVLMFPDLIKDGLGADLAVFENGFDNTFLELAFVEASSDGVHFFRFPATSNTDTTIQTGTFGSTDATKINNLAGKYRGEYGTPFDLSDIPNNPLLDKQAISHIKIIDVVGCIQNQFCTRDALFQKINDPWPTPFGSGGFDLDAVGVIHQVNNVGINELKKIEVKLFPNPTSDYLNVSTELKNQFSLSIINIIGEQLFSNQYNKSSTKIDLTFLPKGIYTLIISSDNQTELIKFCKN